MNNRFLIPLLFLCAGLWRVAAQAPPAVPGQEPVKFDFQSTEAGSLPEGLTVTDGEAKFSVVAEGENKFLQMDPSPLVDGGVLLGASIKGPAVISAKVRAVGKRRSFPRFGVGLHGVGGYRCLVVPAQKELQLVKNDEVVARVPFAWKSGAWITVEFSVLAAGGGARLEGRVWAEGGARPADPLVTYAAPAAPGTGKASVWATPFAELPVDFDEVVITPLP